MEACGVIESAASPYINPLVTVIKKDQSIRPCLDAGRINSVTVPDYEGVVLINEVLASCGYIRVFISLKFSYSGAEPSVVVTRCYLSVVTKPP